MIIDKLLAYFDGTSLPAAQTLSSSVFDLGEDRDPGLGEEMKIFVQSDSLAGGDGKTDIVLMDCATSGGTYADLITLEQVTDAELDAGVFLTIPGPCKQYTKLKLNTTTSNWSAGTVDAYIVKDAQSNS